MNILFVTLNSHLRSTTCVLDAIVSKLSPAHLNPTFAFPEEGPWQSQLASKGHQTYIANFFVPNKLKPLQFLKSVFYWARIIKKHKIDVIHLNEHEYYPMLKYVSYYLNIPILVGVRFVLTGGYARWAFGGKYRPSKLLFTSNDQLERSLSEIPKNFPKKDICVIGNGRNFDTLIQSPNERETTRRKWGIGDDTILIGTASVIRPRKRLEDFIQVVENLIANGFNTKGVIAGGGKFGDEGYFSTLQEIISKKGLQNHIKMLGNLDQMHPFYQSIDLFLSTSELETFGMSVCEAMAFGLPVIGYRGGSVGEVLNDDRFIVEETDPHELFVRTKDFLQLVYKKNYRSDSNQKRALERYNAPQIAVRIQKIYEEVAH